MKLAIGENIRNFRKKNDLTQEALADRLGVTYQSISRWENGTALPDAQNILQISKLFNVTTDYLLNDDYESDGDIPAVLTATKETSDLFSKKKQLHLVSAIGFTISAFCSLMGLLNSTNNTQLGLSCFVLALCVGNAVAQYILFFKKR